MLFEMDRNCYTYPDEHLLRFGYPWYLQEASIIHMMKILKCCLYTANVMITLPVFVELMYYGRITTFLYPCWTPWKLDSLRSQILTFGFQVLQGCYSVYLTRVVSTFSLFTVVEFMRQYHRLMAAVSSLEHRTLQKDVKAVRVDRGLRENIIHCIRHHQILHNPVGKTAFFRQCI
ncbi:unnamed protein product [Allacma fusca]|uniref:Uncharacterized protein n=1 Tax=Allacma fusca TaxID=39272 RepID=A0A8J2KFC1_9HEXA|nr:unnamed protein product [Allacma fusca]